MRKYLGAVAARPRAGFGRVISRGGPNLVLTRVVTAPNDSPPICDRYIDQETTEMREMPTMMHKWQGYLIGLPKEVRFLQTVIYAFYRNAEECW